MKNIPITIKNTGVARTEEPVSVGIPIPKGDIQDISLFRLIDKNGEIPAQFTPLALWPDDSFKWVLLNFQSSVSANSIHNYFIEKTDTPQKNKMQGIVIDERENSFQINTNAATFTLDKHILLPFSKVTKSDYGILRPGSAEIILTDKNGATFVPEIDKISVETRGYLKAIIKAKGAFRKEDNDLLNFIARLHFFKNKSFVKIDFTIWNKGPAKHVGGLWDLGDPGSVLFKDLSLHFAIADGISTEKRFRAESQQNIEKTDAEDIVIYQDSSGGENWQSTNHINRNLQIPVSFKGYRIYQDDTAITEGLRATPIIYVGDGKNGVSATISNFWQNFPKAVSAKQDEVFIHLFPGQFADLHELQGGERKTHSLFLDFGGVPDFLVFADKPLRCILPREWYASTETIPYMSKAEAKEDQLYDDLLKNMVVGENSFFTRREIIDEYGWRNFGEIYADHEAIGYEGKTPLISHYNNQYDQVYGFFREYIASGNAAWFELMDNLAHHVADIDIYHTQKDRDEYNNGLHWHTNHYLDAATCTHRSFSKDHLTEYDAQFYGGGPGMEHCYGSGFMYHYFITGKEISKDALFTLADWVCHCIDEPNTILGGILKVKSMLPLWKQSFSGNKIRADRYPLTRGAGNPLSVLLDAFVLSSDKVYLQKAEEIIKGCIHPHDDIANRDLLDAENGWSYNVCLQAIGKYLDVKISINEFDFLYSYAQESLLHYASWMYENEYPYLEKIEILEFPNETWPAQDLRKSCVFYYAAKHSSGELKEQFLKKAAYFHHYVIHKLNEFETKSLARPIALLMQNRWMSAYFSEHPNEAVIPPVEKHDFTRKNEFWTKREIVKNIVSILSYTLKKTSIDKEFYWLRCRKGDHV